MQLELGISAEEMDGETLLQIYQMFCRAFNIKVDKMAEAYFRERGIKDLIGNFGIDYRPYMGAKFFGTRGGNSVIFHGYRAPKDKRKEKREKEFRRLAQEYFDGRIQITT